MQAKLRLAKRKRGEEEEAPVELKPSTSLAATPADADAVTKAVGKNELYTNKQRVLVFCSRGVTAVYRHLMEDIRKMIPHHKKEAKLDSKDDLRTINEIADVKACNSTVFFEVRKRRDLYMWLSKTPSGPSVKFHVVNVHTMDELRLTGNCLKGSRPLLSFDPSFQGQPHLRLLKELFVQVFGVPRGHPKSQPFHDHVLSFYVVEGRIWLRQYQIVDSATDPKEIKKLLAAGKDPVSLVEIGPRCCLNIIRVFHGSFGGKTLYQNPAYVSPNKLRHDARIAQAQGMAAARDSKKFNLTAKVAAPHDELDDVFK